MKNTALIRGTRQHPPLIGKFIVFSAILFLVILVAGSTAFVFSICSAVISVLNVIDFKSGPIKTGVTTLFTINNFLLLFFILLGLGEISKRTNLSRRVRIIENYKNFLILSDSAMVFCMLLNVFFEEGALGIWENCLFILLVLAAVAAILHFVLYILIIVLIFRCSYEMCGFI